MSFVGIMAILAACIISFCFGVIYSSYKLAKEKLDKYSPEHFAPVYTIHSENGMLYLYAKEDGQFMGQANTVDELAKMLFQARITLAYVIDETLGTYWFINGRAKHKLF